MRDLDARQAHYLENSYILLPDLLSPGEVCTIVPPRLWRDDPDPEVRRFYGKHNAYSRLVHHAMGIPECP
jgi:hypothetical protein